MHDMDLMLEVPSRTPGVVSFEIVYRTQRPFPLLSTRRWECRNGDALLVDPDGTAMVAPP